MSHLDIFSPSYGQKKVWESNWQFDSRPLKVGNRPDPNVYRRSATWRWKALKERYKIALNLIPIRGLSKKLWMPKISGVQIGTVSGLLLESPEKKCHLDVTSAESYKEESHKGRGAQPLQSLEKFEKYKGGRKRHLMVALSDALPNHGVKPT
jgi:hypothetical protein